MLKASEIFTDDKDNPVLAEAVKSGFVYGILVDTDDAGVFASPEGIEEISFIASINQDGEFDEKLLDAAISWNLNGRHVILEFPIVKDDGCVVSDEDINYALMVANNINATLAIIPDRERIDDFIEVICKAASIWIEKKMKMELMPVWNYLVYRFANFYSGGEVDAITPDDVFVKSRYVDVINEEDTNRMKARLDDVFESAFKDEGGFENVAIEYLAAVRKRVIENMEDMIIKAESGDTNSNQEDVK